MYSNPPMAHFREQDGSRPTALRDTLDDARLLIRRYQQRNNPKQALNPDQRREWAEQIVVVLGKLGKLASAYVDHSEDDRVRSRTWLDMFAAGCRPVKPIPQDPVGLRTSTMAERAQQHAAANIEEFMREGDQRPPGAEGGGRTHDLIRRATAVFRSVTEAGRWGDTRAPELNGRSPVEMARESAEGFRRAVVLLEGVREAKGGATRVLR